jgi:hypothetical protein
VGLSAAGLSEPMVVAKGDWAASKMTEFLIVWRSAYIVDNPGKPTPACASASYDTQGNVIIVDILGANPQIENAKAGIDFWWGVIQENFLPNFSHRTGIGFSANDVTIIYWQRNASGGPKEIVRRQKGEYTLPHNQ